MIGPSQLEIAKRESHIEVVASHTKTFRRIGRLAVNGDFVYGDRSGP